MIGGDSPDAGGIDCAERLDPALIPVYEAGGGEEEGFELAEREQIRNASHDDGEGFPERDAFTPQREAELSDAECGEGDDERSPDL